MQQLDTRTGSLSYTLPDATILAQTTRRTIAYAEEGCPKGSCCVET